MKVLFYIGVYTITNQIYGMLLESHLCGFCGTLSQRIAGKTMTSLLSKSL